MIASTTAPLAAYLPESEAEAHLRRRPAHGHGRRHRAERHRTLREGRLRGHRSLAMGERHAALLVDRRRDAHRRRRLPPHVLSGGRRRDHRHVVLVGSSRHGLQRLRCHATSSCPRAARLRSSVLPLACSGRCTSFPCSRCSRSRSRRCASASPAARSTSSSSSPEVKTPAFAGKRLGGVVDDAGRCGEGRGRARLGAGVPHRRDRQRRGTPCSPEREVSLDQRARSAPRGGERGRTLRRGRRPRLPRGRRLVGVREEPVAAVLPRHPHRVAAHHGGAPHVRALRAASSRRARRHLDALSGATVKG